jgi:short-subunit dehydrogenase
MQIRGRRALVTGASSGIGRATARALSRGGADVCLVARRADRLRELATDLGATGAAVVECPLDLTDEDAAEEAVNMCVDRFGGLDILVNAAGRGAYLPTLRVGPAMARAMFDLNVIVPLQMMSAAVPHMVECHDGVIVNIGSNAVRLARPNVGIYAATKAALEVLSVTASAELATAGVRVIVVSPGRTHSEFGEKAWRVNTGDLPPAAGLSPGGSDAVSADFVATKIAHAIEYELPWTAAPLRDGDRVAAPHSWDHD